MRDDNPYVCEERIRRINRAMSDLWIFIADQMDLTKAIEAAVLTIQEEFDELAWSAA